MKWPVQFLLRTTGLLFTFVAVCFLIAQVHHYLTASPFGISWRWIHDSTLLPTNFVLIPLIGVFFFIHAMVRARSGQDFLGQLPRWSHYLTYLLLSLFLVNSISQASGGCIWFVFTEGWWVRFGHGWLLSDGSVIPDELVMSVYLFFTAITAAADLWFFKNYIYKKRQVLIVPGVSKIPS